MGALPPSRSEPSKFVEKIRQRRGHHHAKLDHCEELHTVNVWDGTCSLHLQRRTRSVETSKNQKSHHRCIDLGSGGTGGAEFANTSSLVKNGGRGGP